jgi:hypothetical protein
MLEAGNVNGHTTARPLLTGDLIVQEEVRTALLGCSSSTIGEERQDKMSRLLPSGVTQTRGLCNEFRHFE